MDFCRSKRPAWWVFKILTVRVLISILKRGKMAAGLAGQPLYKFLGVFFLPV